MKPLGNKYGDDVSDMDVRHCIYMLFRLILRFNLDKNKTIFGSHEHYSNAVNVMLDIHNSTHDVIH